MKSSNTNLVDAINEYNHVFEIYRTIRKRLRCVVDALSWAKDATSETYLQNILEEAVRELDIILAREFDVVHADCDIDEYASMSAEELSDLYKEYVDETLKIDAIVAKYDSIITIERKNMAKAMNSNKFVVLNKAVNSSMNVLYDILK